MCFYKILIVNNLNYMQREVSNLIEVQRIGANNLTMSESVTHEDTCVWLTSHKKTSEYQNQNQAAQRKCY